MSLNHPEGARSELELQYKTRKAGDQPLQICPVCGGYDAKAEMEPHHPCGRRGTNILLFAWLHPHCHRWVHDHPKRATAVGMLWPGRNTKTCSAEEWAKLKLLWNT